MWEGNLVHFEIKENNATVKPRYKFHTKDM